MPTLTLESEPLAIGVSFAQDVFRVSLDDGRELSVPLAWLPAVRSPFGVGGPRLLHAAPEQLGHWELIGPGQAIH